MKKISVGILGATGIVGQHYVQCLADHPWFEIGFLASSPQSSGKLYEQAIIGRWHLSKPIPENILRMPVHCIDDIESAKESCTFVFSAVSNETAKMYEELYAERGIPVISNAACHRQSSDVPILIPEVNPEHISIIPIQQRNRGWARGFIVTKPNCSLQSYMIPLAPLHRQFRVQKLQVTTLQAVSGAGYPGIASLDILDNVVPYISGEEEKSEQEPLKIWGTVQSNCIEIDNTITVSAHCNRIPVLEGHLACVSVKFEQVPNEKDILHLWSHFQGLPQQANLPFAPLQPIVYRAECDRPQPRLDKNAAHGMGITVGRLRRCSIFDYRFVALSHNAVRGAAGGGVLNAEMLVSQGYLGV